MVALRKALDVISTVGVWIAGFAILAMAIIGGLDVASTAFLGRPVDSTVEATEILLVVSAFAGLGLLHLRRSHIAVDLLYDRAGKSGRRVLDAFTLLLMTAYFGLLAWKSWVAAIHSVSVREYSIGLVAIPVYPSRIMIAVGLTIAVLCCLTDIFDGARYKENRLTHPDEGSGYE